MITRKNDAFVAKIVNTRLTKGFMAIFAPAESLPSPATLMDRWLFGVIMNMVLVLDTNLFSVISATNYKTDM